MAEISRNPFLLMGITFTPADNALRLSFGKRAVGGTAAVMTKNVPDYAVAAGNPAQVIKHPDAAVFPTQHKDSFPAQHKNSTPILKLTASVSAYSVRRRFCIVSHARGHTVRRR